MKLLVCTAFLLLTSLLFSQKTDKEVQLDSLYTLIDTAQNDTLVVQAYIELEGLLYSGQIDTIEYFYHQIKTVSEHNLKRTDLSEREKYVFESILAEVTSDMGFLRTNRSNLAEGMEFYLKGMKMRERIGDLEGMGNSYNNIATVYNTLKDYEKSLMYSRKSLAIRLKMNDRKNLAIVYNNIGYVFNQLDQPDSALWYYRASYNIYDSLDNRIRKGTLLSNIGSVHENLGDTDSAMHYYKTSLAERKSANSLTGTAIALHNIANLYIKLEQHAKAVPYALEEKEYADRIKNPLYKKRSARIMHEIYKYQGNFKKSLESLERYYHLKDSIQGNDVERELLRQEFNFEYTKKAEQDSIKLAEAKKVADAQLKAQKAENEKREQQAYFLYAIIGLVGVFGFFIFNRFLITRRQKSKIEEQKVIVEEKQNEILDSINYAKGIQEAILPANERMKELLGDHFVLYKPKDIVAGDFYWVDESDQNVIFAAADCTGHGVPGAMVSVVCHNAFHRSVHEFNLSAANEILDKTRELVVETFETNQREVKDGMDVALGSYDKKSKKLQFAGANNNLYLIRKGELIEYKADKQPVGKHPNSKPFTKVDIQLEPEDRVYVFTDGFPDQFGGEKGKKFKYKRLKELLLEVHKLSSKEQSAKLNLTFEQWRGKLEQLDDVCIIGIMIQ